MTSSFWKLGLLAGGAILLYSGVIWLFYNDFSHMSVEQFSTVEMLGYLRYVILILAVTLGIRARSALQQNDMRFWQLSRHGILIALVIALGVALMEAGYMAMHLDFMQRYMELYKQQMLANGATEQMVQQAQQEANSYAWMQNPLMTGLFYFFETAVLGTLSSLIVSFFMRLRMKKAAKERVG